jgi:nitrogen-specific signal transduction histidine kinase
MGSLLPTSLQSGIELALVLLALQVGLVAFWFIQRRHRSRAEGLALENDERLALISSMSTFGFWSWNAVTDTAWASPHARNILGLDAHAPLVGQSLLGAVHPDDRASVTQTINSMTRPDSVEMELRVAGAPGAEIRWITAKACAYCDAKGTVLRVAGYVVDDCQRKRSAAELSNLQQKLTHLTRVALLGELSGALAHELQQPLTAILCNAHAAQLLARKEKLDVDELHEILEEIVSDDKNAGQIIHRLRALLMRGETQFDCLEITDLLDDVLILARGTLRERNVQVSTRIDDDLPEVQGDRVELQQVLLNMVLNACESMGANLARDRRIEIVVGLSELDSSVCISVLDCGKGIEPDQLERVFDPFFTTKDAGLGLGLAISHSIIVAHGGRLWATNRPDRGAAFHFTLPATTTTTITGITGHDRQREYSIHS